MAANVASGFFAELVDVEFGSNQAILFVAKTDEDEGVTAWNVSFRL